MRHQLFIDSDGKAVRRTITFKQRLAASMAMPLRTRLDYAGIARKVFQIEQLPPGALPIYDRDVDVVNLFDEEGFKHNKLRINSEGKAIFQRFGRVILPKFETFSNPTIKIADVKQRRFNLIDRAVSNGSFSINSSGKAGKRRRRFTVIDRAVQRARQEIMAQEDSEIFKKLDELTQEPQPEEKKESFWCEGCGEPRYKCYCNNDCPYCDKKLKDCIAESEDGWCPNDPNIDKLRSV